MAIYMKFGTIKGNATRTNYKDWIILHSVDFIMKRNISNNAGNRNDRSYGMVNFGEIEITKTLDSASNDMFTQFCKAGNVDTVEIHVCSNSANDSPYLKYVLNDVMISHGNRAAVEHSLPLESWRLNYTKLQTTYIKLDANNKPQAPHSAGYDLKNLKLM